LKTAAERSQFSIRFTTNVLTRSDRPGPLSSGDLANVEGEKLKIEN
jgi:hypothetical protein